jgi:hypothetical protein
VVIPADLTLDRNAGVVRGCSLMKTEVEWEEVLLGNRPRQRVPSRWAPVRNWKPLSGPKDRDSL